jgi:hypothetical protein
VPPGSVFILVLLLPFVIPATFIIIIRGSAVIKTSSSVIIVPCRPSVILPPGGRRPGATIIMLNTTGGRPGSLSAMRPLGMTFITILTDRVSFIAFVVIRSTALDTRLNDYAIWRQGVPYRVIQSDMDLSTAQVFAVQVLDGAFSVFAAQVLENPLNS